MTYTPSIRPPEATFQGTYGKYSVPYLEDGRRLPRLPEGVRDGLDPSWVSMYSIGHQAVDAAVEATLVCALEETHSTVLPGDAPYPTPSLVRYLTEGKVPDPAEKIPAVNLEHSSIYLDQLDELNRYTFLPQGRMKGNVSLNSPFYDIFHGALPLKPEYPTDKQPPLTEVDVWQFIRSQDAEISPDALLARFEHYVQVNNFMRGQIIIRHLALLGFIHASAARLTSIPNPARTFTQEHGADFFHDDYLQGKEFMAKVRTHLLHYASLIASRSSVVKLAGSLGMFDGEMQDGIVSYAAGFDAMDVPYPDLLQELLRNRRHRQVVQKRKTGYKAAPRPTSVVRTRAKPVTTGTGVEHPQVEMDDEVRAAFLEESAALNGEVDRLTTTWTLTRNERESVGLVPLSRQLQRDILQGDRHAADGLVSLIHHLRNRIDKHGAEKALDALLSAFQRRTDILAAMQAQRKRAQGTGMPLDQRMPPDLPGLFSYLAVPKHWRDIQGLIREHERSNSTINTINQLLAVYEDRQSANAPESN